MLLPSNELLSMTCDGSQYTFCVAVDFSIQSKRHVGFWLSLLSNLLWIMWGWYAKAFAVLGLQIALATINIRSVRKTVATHNTQLLTGLAGLISNDVRTGSSTFSVSYRKPEKPTLYILSNGNINVANTRFPEF